VWQFVFDLALARTSCTFARKPSVQLRSSGGDDTRRGGCKAACPGGSGDVEAVDVPVRPRRPQPENEPCRRRIDSCRPLSSTRGDLGAGAGARWPTYVTARLPSGQRPAPILDEREPLSTGAVQDDDDFADFAEVQDDELAEIVDRRRAVGD